MTNVEFEATIAALVLFAITGLFRVKFPLVNAATAFPSHAQKSLLETSSSAWCHLFNRINEDSRADSEEEKEEEEDSSSFTLHVQLVMRREESVPFPLNCTTPGSKSADESESVVCESAEAESEDAESDDSETSRVNETVQLLMVMLLELRRPSRDVMSELFFTERLEKET